MGLAEKLMHLLKSDWQKTRERLYRRAKSTLCGLVLAEGILAVTSLGMSFANASRENLFVDANWEAYRLVVGGISILHHHMPLVVRNELGVGEISLSYFDAAMHHPETLKQLDKLFDDDDEKPYTETMGIVTLDEKNSQLLLRFYPLPTHNEELALYFRNNKANDLALIKGISENKGTVCYVTGLSEDLIKKKIDNGEVDEVVHRYLICSYYCGLLTSDIIRNFYADNFGEIDGKIIGGFHLHKELSPPSHADLNASRIMPEFVFVKEGNGMLSAYYINKGEIAAKFIVPVPQLP